jgi:CHASE3 domain sensor protein
MKLAAKLTFTHGLLIFAMLAASTAAYLSMFQVNRITSRFVSERVPVVRQAERLRIDLLKSSRALEQLMLFGADPTDNAYYRKRHHDQWVFGEAAMALLRDLDKHYDLGEDNTRIHTIDEQMSQLNDLENRIEALLVSGKPGDSATAYGLVHVQLGHPGQGGLGQH